MFGLLDWIKTGAGALAGGAVVFGAMSIYDAMVDDPAVRRDTRALVAAESREAALKAIQKRSEDNAEIRDLDSAALCAELDGVWLQREQRCE